MKISQLSVFIENKPGQLSVPCRALADAGINILTMALADTDQFGILRLIVQDWEKARDVLSATGCVVKVNEVVTVDVADRPGGLASVLETIEAAGINIEYMYPFRTKGGPNIVFRFDDADAAIELLQSKGIHVVEADEVFRQIDD